MVASSLLNPCFMLLAGAGLSLFEARMKLGIAVLFATQNGKNGKNGIFGIFGLLFLVATELGILLV